MRLATAPVLALALTFAPSGCAGEPRLDATTEATLRASVRRMGVGLAPAERAEFMTSMMTLTVVPTMERAVQDLFSGDAAPDPSASALMRPLHGLTVRQINAKAAAWREAEDAKPPGAF